MKSLFRHGEAFRREKAEAGHVHDVMVQPDLRMQAAAHVLSASSVAACCG